MGKVKEIKEVYLSNNKAAYSNFKGTILVNRNVFAKLNSNERTFILLHEAGHIELHTKDEHEADNYAFLEYVKMNLPTDSILSAMKQVLTDTPENRSRLNIMQIRINKYNNLYQSFDGSTGDWLSIVSNLFGIGSQIAGGTSTAEQIAQQQAELEKKEQERKRIVGYLLIAGAVVIALIVFSKLKK